MPNGKKLAWIVVVGSVLLTIWLNKKDTRDNELRKWLDTRGLVDMERLLRSLGTTVCVCGLSSCINKICYSTLCTFILTLLGNSSILFSVG